MIWMISNLGNCVANCVNIIWRKAPNEHSEVSSRGNVGSAHDSFFLLATVLPVQVCTAPQIFGPSHFHRKHLSRVWGLDFGCLFSV